METFLLSALGWDNFFETQLSNFNLQGLHIARVTAENKTNYNLQSESGAVIAEVTGRLMFGALLESELPKVGDWVLFAIMDQDKGIIHEILERKTKLSRKAVGKRTTEQIIAANLDVLFIVQGLDDNYNISRLERYMSALQAGINPIVVLNKSDCCMNAQAKIAEVQQRIPGIPVIATSSLNGQIECLRNFISAGKTFAFAGSSGVGKSTLINCLLGRDDQKTAEVRAKDSKGRHTTTRREMTFLDTGGILIDTPGMREFQPWADDENLSLGFQDIDEYAGGCRYADCEHLHEDQCAVKEAVSNGKIDALHYENYLKLKREINYQQTLSDPLKALEKKKRDKEIHRAVKKMYRRKGN
jgi:ribosome biogenesis GTPase